jgi:hypothetical protein
MQSLNEDELLHVSTLLYSLWHSLISSLTHHMVPPLPFPPFSFHLRLCIPLAITGTPPPPLFLM